jgi:enolase-phosphatase E1
MIKYILTDIEGTTTPITFVHDVLFPYSYEHLSSYVHQHRGDPVVETCLADTVETAKKEGKLLSSRDEAVAQLLAWIKEDRKHPALKTLQGLIWRAGYAKRSFQAQIYPDVKPALATWRDRGLKLGVYSSGSVEAQTLLFGHTPDGDLTPFFSHFFDTAVGGKRERHSYERILQALNQSGSEVLFLSDVPEELVAARAAGLATVQIVRPGTLPALGERHAKNFYEVDPFVGR